MAAVQQALGRDAADRHGRNAGERDTDPLDFSSVHFGETRQSDFRDGLRLARAHFPQIVEASGGGARQANVADDFVRLHHG